MKKINLWATWVFALIFSAAALGLEKTDELRVYVLNGGSMSPQDMKNFSDTFEYEGKPGYIENPCFLIQHPKGLLMWDTGLGDDYYKKPGDPVWGIQVSVTLESQLENLGVKFSDIHFVAFSHTHGDHTGNAHRFENATWLWQQKEWDYVTAKKVPGGSRIESLGKFKNRKKEIFSGDYDVFQDGTVRIISTPGHTPGHQSLLVKLKNKPVMMTGDLYHLRENRENKRVPIYNVSRADTLASMNRFETIAKNLGAKVIIQHDAEEFKDLPKVPKYLH